MISTCLLQLLNVHHIILHLVHEISYICRVLISFSLIETSSLLRRRICILSFAYSSHNLTGLIRFFFCLSYFSMQLSKQVDDYLWLLMRTIKANINFILFNFFILLLFWNLFAFINWLQDAINFLEFIKEMIYQLVLIILKGVLWKGIENRCFNILIRHFIDFLLELIDSCSALLIKLN